MFTSAAGAPRRAGVLGGHSWGARRLSLWEDSAHDFLSKGGGARPCRVHVAGEGLGSDGTRARPRLLEDQVEELGLSRKDRGEQ